MKKTYFAISPSYDMDGPYNTVEQAKLAAIELVEDDQQTCYVVSVEYTVYPGHAKVQEGYKK